MDYSLEQWINGPAGSHPLWDTFMIGVAGGAEPAFIALVVVWFLIGWRRRLPMDRQGAIAALLASGGALLVNVTLASIWYRPRPYIVHPDQVHHLLSHSADSSFPSDHAAAAFAIAIVLFSYRRFPGVVALIVAALVAYSRVYVGDHYPTDVIAGAVIGTGIGYILVRWLSVIPKVIAWFVDGLMVRLHLLRDGSRA